MSTLTSNFTVDFNYSIEESSACQTNSPQFYKSLIINLYYAVPEWEAIITLLVLSTIILGTIIGNIMVVISVFTYKPLRIVQNFFIVSLAVADLTVAIFVLPLNVVYYVLGKWIFGIYICKIWLTCDVLCCTASILNLCAIALDRYWAITDPIQYAQQRTLKRVLIMILSVWFLSALISSPPLLGWNDWPENFEPETPCQLTKKKGYVVYSSLGSFFIPLLIMTIVYVEIFLATKKRLRDRATASKLNIIKQTTMSSQFNNKDVQSPLEAESISSETDTKSSKHKSKKKKKTKKKNSKSCCKNNNNNISLLRPQLITEDSITDFQDTSSSSPKKSSRENNMNGGDHSIDLNKEVISSNSVHNVRNNVPTELNLKPCCKSEVSVVVVASPIKANSTQVVKQFIEEKQRISLSKERRAARTLGIIMGVFVVCWLPFFLMYVILPFCTTCCVFQNARIINLITWLGYINSGINPIIYTIFNLDFRKSFKKLLNYK